MLVKRFYQDGTMDIIDIYIGKDRDRHLLKTMRTILHALSYGNIEVESSRRLVDLKKLDAMRIFLRKLDVKVYNGDYEVPVRLYFPTEEAMQRNLQEPLDFPVLPAHLTSLEFLKSQIYFPVLLRPLPGHLPFQSL